jgi:hypothetical protein
MAEPGRRDHRITLADAAGLTRRHRDHGQAGETRSISFGREAFEAILAQAGCTGIRIYLGEREDGEVALVLVGVDESLADLAEGEVMDRGWPCPPACGPESALER